MTNERPEPFFIAGAAGLDFLNSIATPIDVPVEWLASGEDLLNWLQRANLIPSGVAETFRKTALPGELDAVAAQARDLREWFRGFARRHKGKPLGSNVLHELEPLNQLLARDEEFGQIVSRDAVSVKGLADGAPLQWVPLRRWRSPQSLLLPIAEALADVVCHENFADIKSCEGAVCTLIYVDRTRSRARRWCSMSACGNRWKQAAHRERNATRSPRRK